MYAYLKKLPSAHHSLATLCAIILLKSHETPASWCARDLHLIYISGTPTDPANYRPIALSSVVGKLFHQIVAYCLEMYLLNNCLINSKLQKGFLKGINTLSQILFFLCFSSITAYAGRKLSTGFKMTHTLPHSSKLSPIWMEEESDKSCGWYLAQTKGYTADGRASINYMNGCTKMVNQVEWAFIGKSFKGYLPINVTVPHFPLKKVREEAKQPKKIKLSPRAILTYTNDTTIILASPSAHQHAFDTIQWQMPRPRPGNSTRHMCLICIQRQ